MVMPSSAVYCSTVPLMPSLVRALATMEAKRPHLRSGSAVIGLLPLRSARSTRPAMAREVASRSPDAEASPWTSSDSTGASMAASAGGACGAGWGRAGAVIGREVGCEVGCETVFAGRDTGRGGGVGRAGGATITSTVSRSSAAGMTNGAPGRSSQASTSSRCRPSVSASGVHDTVAEPAGTPIRMAAYFAVMACSIRTQRSSSCSVSSRARRVPADSPVYLPAAASRRLTLAGVQVAGISVPAYARM